MTEPTRDELAARIAQIEGAGSGRTGGLRSPRPADERALGSGVGERAAAVDPRIDPSLPERAVEDDRGQALRDLSGQREHDAALGVAPDGRPLDPGEDDASRGRARRPTPATLAFSDAAPHQQAIDLAYKLVGQRERSERQLAERLRARGCDAAAVRAAVAELARQGFVDDRRYARVFAEDKRRLQGWGERRIRIELGRAGISRPIVDDLFASGEEALDAPSEVEAGVALLSRRRPDLTDPRAARRAAAMLARRGLAPESVRRCLRDYAQLAGADDGSEAPTDGRR